MRRNSSWSLGRLPPLGGVAVARRLSHDARGRSNIARAPTYPASASRAGRSSTAENCPVTPITARTASGSRAASWAADPHVATVSGDQRREDLDGGGLAGAVRAEQGEDRPFGDGQVHPVEDRLVAEGLAEPHCRERSWWRGEIG